MLEQSGVQWLASPARQVNCHKNDQMLEKIFTGRRESMDKSLPVNEKTGEKVREEEGVIGSQHWEPRIRWDHGKLSVL